MTKKFLSAVMALSMAVCTFTGCSDLDKDGNLKEAISYETVEYEDVRYKVRSDFIDITEAADMNSPAYTYGLSGDVMISFSVWMNKSEDDTQTKLDWQETIFADYQNKSTEIIEDEEYDIAIFTADLPVEKDEKGKEEKPARNMDLHISRRNHPLDNFGISVTYTKDNDEKLMRELGLEMLKSVEYIGEEEPTEPVITSFDNDYFTYEIPVEFSDKVSIGENSIEDGVCNIRYYFHENLSEKNCYIYIKAIEHTRFETAEEYLKNEISNNKDRDGRIIITKKPYETEFLGYNCWCVEYNRDSSVDWADAEFVDYAIMNNGITYDISIKTNSLDGSEQVDKDFEKLVENIVIKDISAEKQAELEAEKIHQYETENFAFSFPIYIETYDEQENYFSDRYGGTYEIKEYDGDVEMSLEKRAKELQEEFIDYSAYKHFKGDVEIGGKNLSYYTLQYNDDSTDIYGHIDTTYFLYEENGKFLLVIYAEEYEKRQDIFNNEQLNEFFSTVRLK